MQVRRVRLADGRRLRGRIFPEFTDFIPKNLEYLPKISVRSTRKKFWGHKKLQGWGAKMAIRSAKLTFGGGKKFGSTKAPGGQRALYKKEKKVATFDDAIHSNLTYIHQIQKNAM